MKSELIIRRIAAGRYDVTDIGDSAFELRDITEAQLLGYLKYRKFLEIPAESVLKQFEVDEERREVHVAVDQSL